MEGKAKLGKQFKEKVNHIIYPTPLLYRLLSKIILNSYVITKDIIDPDDNLKRTILSVDQWEINTQCTSLEWINPSNAEANFIQSTRTPMF